MTNWYLKDQKTTGLTQQAKNSNSSKETLNFSSFLKILKSTRSSPQSAIAKSKLLKSPKERKESGKSKSNQRPGKTSQRPEKKSRRRKQRSN